MRTEKEIILDKLKESVDQCKACALRQGCDRTVTGDGNPWADIMFVGANPSFSGGNVTGKNFTGVSGKKFFTYMSEQVIDREECYVTNVLKCAAHLDAISEKQTERSLIACRSHFLAELNIIRPHVVVTLGRLPFMAITEIMGCTIEKFIPGDCIDFKEFDLFIMNHPSYYLNHGHEEDMKRHVGALKKYFRWRENATTFRKVR